MSNSKDVSIAIALAVAALLLKVLIVPAWKSNDFVGAIIYSGLFFIIAFAGVYDVLQDLRGWFKRKTDH